MGGTLPAVPTGPLFPIPRFSPNTNLLKHLY